MSTLEARKIKDVRYGTQSVRSLYLGETKIWPSLYLRVVPHQIFLSQYNNFTDDTDVLSNVRLWIARVNGGERPGSFDLSFDDSFDN